MYDGIYDMLNCEIEKIEKKGELNAASLDNLDKLVDIIKDLQTIEAMAEYEKDGDGYSERRGYLYGDDMSYRRGYMDGNRGSRYYMGRSMNTGHNRDDGKKAMMEHLEKAMHNAETVAETEEIRRMIEKMEAR